MRLIGFKTDINSVCDLIRFNIFSFRLAFSFVFVRTERDQQQQKTAREELKRDDEEDAPTGTSFILLWMVVLC